MQQHYNYYHILGISSHNASDQNIRRAYRAMALRYHPDRNPGNRRALQRFILANRAYNMLKTRPQREAYNRYLLRQMRPAKGAPSQKPSALRRFFGLIIEIFWPFAFRQEASHG